ncbi:AraC family transcriptional regulator [Hydrogenophaga palleronii]|uniref:AraC family transcriptional regulator n=1 Tax=Hydrogenophaga palleronii TaxID=65655 RepID=UPI00082562F0|nr:AraC family transcriptional regulator [Hydrogenophaga palleronii]
MSSPFPTRPDDVFLAGKTHGIAHRSEVHLLRESASLRWRSLYASLVQESPWTADLPEASAPGIAYCVASASPVTRTLSRVREEDVLRPRQFSLVPNQRSSRWTISGRPRILHLYVHDAIFRQVADELFRGASSVDGLIPRLCTHDPVIAHLAETTIHLLYEGDACSAYQADHLAYMLASRLLSHHSDLAPRKTGPVPGPRVYRWQRLLDHIDEHLADDLSLETMAASAGLPATQLWRLFRAHLGTSPHQYILTRRLEQARHLLENSADPIADIALQTGFSSQSHLTSAFKKHFQSTPAQHRRHRRG